MSSSTFLEVFGQIVVSFTRGVTDHYNPEEPEFTAESFGYDPLQSTGLEWNYEPVDEIIYQEYSDRELTTLDYLAASRIDIRVINACSPEEDEEIQENQQHEDRAMAWKRLRPSGVRAVCKSMYIGALISLLTATIIGSLYSLISYVCYQTMFNCEFHPRESIPMKIQWIRTLSDATSCGFIYMWLFVDMLLLLRPYQLMGVKRKLILVIFLLFCLDVLYRVLLQIFEVSYSKPSTTQKIPLFVLFLISLCWQGYLLTNHFQEPLRRRRMNIFLQMISPSCFTFVIGIFTVSFIYPMYNKQNDNGKLLIALFAPLIGVVLKVILRICVQRLWNITHPGYSYVLLVPLYLGSAVMFRVLQADLDNIKKIAILGIIHGAAEVMERSTMVVIDHICHVLWKRTSAPWGSFRTPRRERLMADIAIMSMLYESTAIVSVNGVLYLHQFIYLKDNSFSKLLQEFAINTSIQLVIEWFFTSVSLAIETHYQNMAVMAVWRRRWKRHILVAILNVIPLVFCSTLPLLGIVHGHLDESESQPCKMPFT